MKDSHIVKELISLAFDADPADTDITLADCLALYGRVLLAEERRILRHQVSPMPEPETFPHIERPNRTENDVPENSGGGTAIPPGRGGRFKADVLTRLRAYRAANGLGCYRAVCQAANDAITEDEIRAMHDCKPYPLAKWKVLDAALAYLESKSRKGAQ